MNNSLWFLEKPLVVFIECGQSIGAYSELGAVIVSTARIEIYVYDA